MKRSRFSEEQIIGILRQADAEIGVAVLYRQIWLSEIAFCKWRSEFGGMSVSGAKRLKQF